MWSRRVVDDGLDTILALLLNRCIDEEDQMLRGPDPRQSRDSAFKLPKVLVPSQCGARDMCPAWFR